ncbi:hypothetical protein BDV93DRAFT_516069 [Ceratobasidium sp. AG-I]|nr:hypothetical protein BDV93DRAFT_516069 [Ceratobasidium sp. AG-I]
MNGPGTPSLAYKKVHYAQAAQPSLVLLHHHNISLTAKSETPAMELDQHASKITEITQRFYCQKQGQDSNRTMSPRPLSITHTEEYVERRTHSDSDHTCKLAEMNAAHGDVMSQQTTNGFCLVPDKPAWSTLSAHRVLRRKSKVLNRPKGLAPAMDRTAENMVALDDSCSPKGDDELTDLFDLYQRFQSSMNGTDSDLPTLDMLILCLSDEEFLGDSNDIELALILLMLSLLLVDRARILNAVEDTDRAIECLTRAARGIRGIPTWYVRVSQALASAFKRRHEEYGRAGDIDLAIEYQQQSVASAGDTHEDYATLIAELGSLYNLRFRVMLESTHSMN